METAACVSTRTLSRVAVANPVAVAVSRYVDGLT